MSEIYLAEGAPLWGADTILVTLSTTHCQPSRYLHIIYKLNMINVVTYLHYTMRLSTIMCPPLAPSSEPDENIRNKKPWLVVRRGAAIM